MRLTYLKSKFPRALPTKDGGVLRTVAEARSYIIALPKPRAQRQHWQHVARLIIEQADIAELARLVHLALFLDGKLDQPPWTRRRRREPGDHHSMSGTTFGEIAGGDRPAANIARQCVNGWLPRLAIAVRQASDRRGSKARTVIR